MTTDNGGAPCIHGNVLSLSICKPQIRSTCEKGDWILGIGGKSTIGERLIYIAQITQKLINGEYYCDTQYHHRPDCIYRWSEDEKKYYWEKGKKYHKNGLQLEHDLGVVTENYKNANTLLSNNFIYFGKIDKSDYKLRFNEIKLLIEDLGQGHRINHSPKLKGELRQLIEDSLSLSTFYDPTESDVDKLCNIDDDCQECC